MAVPCFHSRLLSRPAPPQERNHDISVGCTELVLYLLVQSCKHAELRAFLFPTQLSAREDSDLQILLLEGLPSLTPAMCKLVALHRQGLKA